MRVMYSHLQNKNQIKKNYTIILLMKYRINLKYLKNINIAMSDIL